MRAAIRVQLINFNMKKLLGIIVPGLLLSGNANALIVSCKSYLNGEIILNDAYDLGSFRCYF